MTLWSLVLAALRRWPIVLAGVWLTGLAVLLVSRGHPVYWTRVEVQFLAPASLANPNSIRTASEDIIVTAGAIARRINGPEQVTKYASPDVTLVGLGVERGWSVRLPDTGGQWAPHFARQTLMLEVADPDPESLQEQLDEATARIARELDGLQRELGVDPVNHITIMVAPEPPTVHRVTGSRVRAAAMVGAMGAGATLAVIIFLEGRTAARGIGKPQMFARGTGHDPRRAWLDDGLH